MDSSTSNTSKNFFQILNPLLAPPLAAACAIIPTYHGFVRKSALQIQAPLPPSSLSQKLKDGMKAAPIIGSIVGTQLVLQSSMDRHFHKTEHTSLASLLATSTLIASISAPLLTIFNGRTLGYSAKESLKKSSLKQTAAIVIRETSFIFSLGLSGPCQKYLKSKDLNSKPNELAATFLSGALGSAFGHPADTALTLWQKNIPIPSVLSLFRGLATKSTTVGLFSCLYTTVIKQIAAGKELSHCS